MSNTEDIIISNTDNNNINQIWTLFMDLSLFQILLRDTFSENPWFLIDTFSSYNCHQFQSNDITVIC